MVHACVWPGTASQPRGTWWPWPLLSGSEPASGLARAFPSGLEAAPCELQSVVKSQTTLFSPCQPSAVGRWRTEWHRSAASLGGLTVSPTRPAGPWSSQLRPQRAGSPVSAFPTSTHHHRTRGPPPLSPATRPTHPRPVLLRGRVTHSSLGPSRQSRPQHTAPGRPVLLVCGPGACLAAEPQWCSCFWNHPGCCPHVPPAPIQVNTGWTRTKAAPGTPSKSTATSRLEEPRASSPTRSPRG